MSANAKAHFTEHFRLVVDNDQKLYDRRRELVQHALADSRERFQGRPNVAITLLSDALKDWASDMLEPTREALEHPHFRQTWSEHDAARQLTNELLSSALCFIDWRTLATDYIEEEDE